MGSRACSLALFVSALGIALASEASAELKWGAPKRDHCRAPGLRQYSAVLHGIPPFHSWEATCHGTPATVQGKYFPHPTRCVNKTTAMWGEFDVPDESCSPPKPMRWGAFKKDHCSGPGLRQYSAVLHDTPAGMSWEQTCQNPVGAKAPPGAPSVLADRIARGERPDRCRKAETAGIATGMWGEYDVPDDSCQAPTDLEWGAWKDDGCIVVPLARNASGQCTGPKLVRQYSAVLWNVPSGYSWEAACADARIEIGRGNLAAIELPRPDVCVRATGNEVFKYGSMIASTAVGMAPGFVGAGLGLASSIGFDMLGQDEVGAFNMWGIVYVDDPSCQDASELEGVQPRLLETSQRERSASSRD